MKYVKIKLNESQAIKSGHPVGTEVEIPMRESFDSDPYNRGPKFLKTKRLLGNDLKKINSVDGDLVDDSAYYFESPLGLLSIEAIDIDSGGEDETYYDYFYVTIADESSEWFGTYLGTYVRD